jgi:hypothetical protein
MTLRFERTPQARRDALREALPAAVELLKRRRAAEIAPADIDDYVAMNWLEWNGGGLRLTTTGDNVCKQLAPRSLGDDPPISRVP